MLRQRLYAARVELSTRAGAQLLERKLLRKSATHSMCGVWGNMSTGCTRSSAQPASASCRAFGASVVGLQET